MGKGKRNSLRRDEDKVQNADKYLEKQKTENKKSAKDKAVALVCVLFAVLIAAVLVVSLMSDSGVFLRAKTAAETGAVEVDAAMMSYFLNDHILTWYNTYGVYVSYGLFSLNMSQDFRTQPYGANSSSYEISMLGDFDDVSTWYDYFFKSAYEGSAALGTIGVEQYITYAQAAKDKGLSLDKEDDKEIKELLKQLDESLKASNASYSDWYGRGVKKSDVRKCYELIFLAEKFVEQYNEELIAALDKELESGDAVINKFIEDNKSDFYTAEYLSYEISLKSNSYINDEFYDQAVSEAKEAAEKIAAAKTPAEFVQLIEEYEAADVKETESETESGTEDVSVAESESETLSPEEELESKIEELKDTASYDTEGELNEWLFVEGAKENDAKVIEETETATEKETESETEDESESETAEDKAKAAVEKDNTYEIYTVTVYFVTKASSLDKTETMDYAFLASNSKADVEQMLATFKAGEMTADKFKEVAQAQYDAVHGDEDHEHSDDELFQFDSVEKTLPGNFNDSYKVLNEWLEAKPEAKTLSEIFEVTVEEKNYYAVVFFEGYNDEKYHVDAYNGILNERFEAWYEEASKAVKLNAEVVAELDTLIMYSDTTSDGHDH